MNFPVTRMRRLRKTEAMRSLVRETHLHPGALVYPLFVCPGEGVRKEISSMPGVFKNSKSFYYEYRKQFEESLKAIGIDNGPNSQRVVRYDGN